MKYEECYRMIVQNFKEKIDTDDKLLKIKIFNNLLRWYKNNFESDLKLCFENDNKLGIISITKQIETVCKKSDLEKLEIVYSDDTYENFIKLSDYIFSLVRNSIKVKDYSLSDNDLNEYSKKLESYSSKIPEFLLEKYKYYKSECILDLNYLKNKGNVTTYSIRTHNLLISQK